MASKCVIVTGASRGLGYAVAESLLRDCHDCFLVARSENELKKLKSQYPNSAEYMAANLADFDV
jgi:NADP-dependent 3-hydroxy acid dehydrogenase YdfG